MMTFMLNEMDEVKQIFGNKLQENVRMANYTTIRVGGPVAGLLPVNTDAELENAAIALWEHHIPFKVIGSGSNFLVSDKGYDGIILLNRAHNLKIQSTVEPYTVYAESGAIFGTVARQSAMRGLSGLEWANSVPGTVGGAVYGNAGALGSDVCSDLIMATILHPLSGKENWPVERLGYQYRSSILKREKMDAIILSALFKVKKSTREEAQTKIVNYSEKRRKTQPEGPSFGSTFRNPEGDYAGRLIEAAGLKGHIQGHAQISKVHANFIINQGEAKAADIYQLICLARNEVKLRFNVDLVLEIELLGEFDNGK
jgi:UDP-N-acetylmuramate dehydrogenase